MRFSLAVLADAALIVVFAAIGRSSHDEGLAVVSILGVAWPFLVGAGVGWAVAYTASQLRNHEPFTVRFTPARIAPDGLLIAIAAVVVGMLVRGLLTDRGIQPSFVVVATIVLSVFLLGWRAVVAVRTRRKSALTT